MAKSTRESERAAVRRDAEDGSKLAGQVLRDMAEEDGIGEEFAELRVGNWVAVFTVTLFHIGRIEALTDEWIVLEKGNNLVTSTGPMEQFYAGRCQEFELMPVRSRIRRGCVTNVTDWPHDKALTPAAS